MADKKPTYEELLAKIDFYEEGINESRKQVRKALTDAGIWHQDFHGAEVTAITAVFLAARKTLASKEKALGIAIQFIGTFEDDTYFGPKAIETLEDINIAIASETIEESIKRQEGK